MIWEVLNDSCLVEAQEKAIQTAQRQETAAAEEIVNSGGECWPGWNED